jgi:hypothetical protein
VSIFVSGRVTQKELGPSVPPLTILIGKPSFSALSTAGNATSANSVSPAIMLRTLVPPPFDVRMPVTSTPDSLKYPFSNAIA